MPSLPLNHSLLFSQQAQIGLLCPQQNKTCVEHTSAYIFTHTHTHHYTILYIYILYIWMHTQVYNYSQPCIHIAHTHTHGSIPKYSLPPPHTYMFIVTCTHRWSDRRTRSQRISQMEPTGHAQRIYIKEVIVKTTAHD